MSDIKDAALMMEQEYSEQEIMMLISGIELLAKRDRELMPVAVRDNKAGLVRSIETFQKIYGHLIGKLQSEI
jgi:hypothetical protein